MKVKSTVKTIALMLLVLLFTLSLVACTPPPDATGGNKYPIVDDNNNKPNKDTTTKDQAIDLVMEGVDNLLKHTKSEDISNTGYYVGADGVFNTTADKDNSSFKLKLRANMYTYPYIDDDGNVDEAKLAIHNQLIKKNDMIIEWYDGTTNTMLIGFYFDGINPNSADPGNNLYLNLQGSKRIFPKFGDSVLYQQIVRLITQFNLDALLGGGSQDGGSTVNSLDFLLRQVVTTNYKKVINGDVNSVFFHDINLAPILSDINGMIQDMVSPFEDKVDPLTNKYLGFNLSTLGTSEVIALNSDMQYLMAPELNSKEMIMTGAIVDLEGKSNIQDKTNKDNPVTKQMPWVGKIGFDYAMRPATNIVIDKQDYKLYEYGQYEYKGEMFIPMLDLKLDALIRTDMQEDNNKENRVFMQFRDKANDDLIIGAYYKDEKTYIDTTGLQHLYGGIKLEDIGLPRAYKEGFDLAALLKSMFDMIDDYIIKLVDDILAPTDGSDGDILTGAIMDNMESTVRDPKDPTSRNTIKLRIDIELIRILLKQNSDNGLEYTNDQIVEIINRQFGIDIRSIASILGMSVDSLLDNTWFRITFDVDSNNIKIEIFSDESGKSELVLVLDLEPVKIGESVVIVFPDFRDFKPLKKIMTYSGYLEGEFTFSSDQVVDFSELFGAFMGDKSGLNTPFILPSAASLTFKLWYDQYIREQVLENGRWTEANRSAFHLVANMMEGGKETELFRLYANDVSFDTTSPIEKMGYIWVDFTIYRGTEFEIPKFKIREDLFILSMYNYMGYETSEDIEIVIGLTDILQILMEDSWIVFEPDVISITTSNQTLKNLFKVDELIGNVRAQIGLIQRVKNIDEIEKDFARFTVHNFSDISGFGPYSIKLHDKIRVTFDWGNRILVQDFLFKYDAETIKVTTGKLNYYPSFDGKFMGVSRSYHVRVTGGLVGASPIIRLQYSEYELEPLLPKPTKVFAYYDGTKSAEYAADFEIDWSTITIQGGLFKDIEVIIGKGMMSTYTEKVTLNVLDRRVVANKYVNINTRNGKAEAPVADKISVDSYQYILEKAAFVKSGGSPSAFVSYYFGKIMLSITFMGSTPSELNKFYNDIAFDFQNQYQLYAEEDINNKIAEGTTDVTYIYIVFRNQVIAFAVEIESRTVDYIMFEDEKEKGIYTVDTLIESTYQIPVNPTVYFKEKDAFGEAYKINFAEYGVPLKWTNEIDANQLKFENTVRPLKGTDGSVTQSYIDLKYYLDRDGVFMSTEWYLPPVVTVTIQVPDKVIDLLDNVGGFVPSNIKAQYDKITEIDTPNGQFFVDPYNRSTYKLPNKIDVTFLNFDNTKYSKDYQVDWKKNSTVSVIEGEYFVNNIGKTQKYFAIKTQIGNDTIGYLEVTLVINNLSGEVSNILYLDEEGKTLAGDILTSPTEDGIYNYIVDTYTRFGLPSTARVKFIDGTIRSYSANWQDTKAWKPGLVTVIKTQLGTGSLTEEISLRVKVEARNTASIELLQHDNTVENIVYDIINKKIIISGAVAKDGLIDGKSVYEYIYNLLSELKIIFVEDSANKFERELILRDIIAKDLYHIMDSQKMISATGQDIILIIGNGEGADDYVVNIKIQGVNKIESGTTGNMDITRYNNDNTIKYPNGFVFDNELAIKIKYAGDDRIYTYGKDGEFQLPKWSVVTSTINGIYTHDIIESISLDALMGGGKITVSTMLMDGSRVYRTIDIKGIAIGENYESGANELFKIKDGTITIDDIYSVYPLNNTLTQSRLPQYIFLTKEAGYRVDNIRWQLEAGIADILRDINSQTNLAKTKVASATVMGEVVNLYLVVKESKIKNITYTDATDATRNFTTKEEYSYENMTAKLSLDFDAYHNRGYNTTFIYNRDLVATFGNGTSHRFATLNFSLEKDDGSVINNVNAIVYNFNGGIYQNNLIKTAKIMTTLADGQKIEIVINFLDKTVVNVIYEKHTAGNYTIDPYGDTAIPQEGTIVFREGKDYTIPINWLYPTDYAVDYNTNKTFSLTSILSAGLVLTSQVLSLSTTILDRTMATYEIVDTYTDNKYHISDPFAKLASNLPNKIKTFLPGANYNEGMVSIYTLDIIWSIEEQAISANGTVGLKDGYLSVIGRLRNSNGQPLELKLYIDRWTLSGIKKPIGGGEYQVMTDIRFFFSIMNDISSYSKYQMVFETLDPYNLTQNRPTSGVKNVEFTPEDVLQATGTKSDYILVWDQDAKAKAKREGLATAGRFYLANSTYGSGVVGNGIKISPLTNSIYEFESPSISELDFGYGYGTRNNALMIVDPTNPVFSTNPEAPFVSKAKAKGVYNLMPNTELGEVTIDWRNGDSKISFNDKYIKGGVYRGYTVKVYFVADTFTYTQTFEVLLAFLDLSPTTQPSIDADVGKNMISYTSNVLLEYGQNSYNGKVNPYEDVYGDIYMYLNKAFDPAVYVPHKNIEMKETDKILNNYKEGLTYDNIVWLRDIPTEVPKDEVIFSKSFVVKTKTYYSNMLMLTVRKGEVK